jgi:hypothetical protein
MGATAQTSTESPPATAEKPLVDKIDFGAMFSELASKGYPLSEAEQARLEEICREEIKKQNNGNLLGLNIGGSIVNLVSLLFACIQKLFGGETSLPSSIEGFGAQLSGAADGADNKAKMYVINTINMKIYNRLEREGGTLAQVKDLVAGLNIGGPARDMDPSLMRQIMTAQNIPWGTTSSLTLKPKAPTTLADASQDTGHGLPPTAMKPSNTSLTPQARGA